MTNVLLVGESWSTTSIHTKGFDSFTTSEYSEGGEALLKVLKSADFEVAYMPCHIASAQFPYSVEELSVYDVILLSDIGANTLLLPGETFIKGEAKPNRLLVIKEWVAQGGGFAMIGGYLSFQGIEAKANYRNTVLAEVLPIEMEVGDDREETPQGSIIKAVKSHQITEGLGSVSSKLLGFQRFAPKPEGEVLVEINEHPFLVVGNFGEGRVLAYASDIGHHWAPPSFTESDGFRDIWVNSVNWLAKN
jgi:uncharacterized membrane protein